MARLQFGRAIALMASNGNYLGLDDYREWKSEIVASDPGKYSWTKFFFERDEQVNDCTVTIAETFLFKRYLTR